MKYPIFLALTIPFIAFGDPVTPKVLKTDPKLVNFGYNKFIPSPYSNKLVVVTFDSPKGVTFFERSTRKNAFFKLAPHFAPQQTITTCGIASGVIILNTLYADSGKTPPLSLGGSFYDSDNHTVYGEYIWTEENFFTPRVAKILDPAVIIGDKKVNGRYELGVTLDQLANALKLHGLKVTTRHAECASKFEIGKFRRLVKAITRNPTQYMIVNYSLTLYQKDGGGHFSPIAAYDEISDSVLILDTWSASNCWLFVKLEDLYKSMNTLSDGSYRGYLLICANL